MKVFYIKHFCEECHSVSYRQIEDVDGSVIHITAGFRRNKRLEGFVWYRNSEYDHPYFGMEDTFYRCGIQGAYGWVVCGVTYRKDTPEERAVVGSPEQFPELRIELENGLPVFCGMQENGMRHGLGSEWRCETDGTVTETQGLWQNGILTHLREGGRLVPVEGTKTKA